MTTPERIWIDPRGGRWVKTEDAQEDHGDVEYIRADLLDAAVNEALERAAAKMDAEWSYRAGDAIRAMKKETGK